MKDANSSSALLFFLLAISSKFENLHTESKPTLSNKLLSSIFLRPNIILNTLRAFIPYPAPLFLRKLCIS